MPRIRTIKPEFFTSETLAMLSVEAERTFTGVWTQADDQGRLKDQPAVLNGQLWALRPQHRLEDMEKDLDSLEMHGLICRYEVGGRRFMHVTSWDEHQKINRPSASKLPPCPKPGCGGNGAVRASARAGTQQLPGLGGDDLGQSVPQHRKAHRSTGEGAAAAIASSEAGPGDTAAEPARDTTELAAHAAGDPGWEDPVVDRISRIRSVVGAGRPDPDPATTSGTATTNDTATTSDDHSEGEDDMARRAEAPDDIDPLFDVSAEQRAAQAQAREAKRAAEREKARESSKTTPEGKAALAIFQPWWDRYKDKYAQEPFIIMKILKGLIKDGKDPEALAEALEILGEQGEPIKGTSLQFAMSRRGKRRHAARNTGFAGISRSLSDDSSYDTSLGTVEGDDYYSTAL